MVKAFFGSVRIFLKVLESSSNIYVRIGSLPKISGINPNSFKSFGIILEIICLELCSESSCEFLKPTELIFNLLFIILSIPSKAPPAIKRILDVFSLIKFWSGCFLPPFGGTLTTAPSISFSKAC